MMNKNIINKILFAFIAVVVCTLCVPTGCKIYAAADKVRLESKIVYCFEAPNNGLPMPVTIPLGAKITKISSSNKNIIKLTTPAEENNYNGIHFFAKKAGKATLTYTVKQGDKKYTLKQYFVVKKSCPLRMFTVNGKSRLAAAKTQNTAHIVDVKKKKNTIKWKAAKGYNIIKVYSEYNRQFVRSGYTLKLSRAKKREFLRFYFKDNQNREYQFYLVPVYYKD